MLLKRSEIAVVFIPLEFDAHSGRKQQNGGFHLICICHSRKQFGLSLLVSINVTLLQLGMDGPQFGCLLTFHTLHKMFWAQRNSECTLS